MNDKIEVTLLGVSAYSFDDDKTGRRVEGVNVWFAENSPVSDETTKGFIPKKASMPYESFGFFNKLEYPQKANALLETRFTNRGVATKIKDFEPKEKTVLK